MFVCLHSLLQLAVIHCVSALFDLKAISFRLKPRTDSKLCDPAVLRVCALWALKDNSSLLQLGFYCQSFGPHFH